MNRKNQLRIFSTIEELNQSAAQFIADLAGKSVTERKRFVLCLAGGDTPKSLYHLLSLKPFVDLVPWKNTFVFWSDERYVPAGDLRNNANMADSALLSKTDITPSRVFPIPVNTAPAEAAVNYEKTLKAFFGNSDPRFDLILLGLGENGHTASLFPGTMVLQEKTHWVKEVYVEGLQMYRVTMTVPLINRARHVLFLVTGKEKSQILETVLTASFQPEKYPAQLINPDSGDVTWFADYSASTPLLRTKSSFDEKK